ncbi:ankyrin-2-like [Coffea eugenioides]|uniref:ankyrin-2-like n=1 Tax=Coffea eugenioides TaxID=49369 RepID=UPI000F606D37|nr:ankyrin-2-like [Coffea eugenioides]
MDPQLYNAAQSGDSDVIRQYADRLDSQLTPNNKTVLHILAQFCDSSYAVEQILGINHSLLCKQNAKGDTALHVAARKRYSGVVRALIDCAKDGEKPDKHNSKGWIKMLRLTNDGKDTALHVAVRTICYDIVELLVKQDDELPHPRNKAGECPLYLAVERGYHDIVDLILGTCKSPSYHGPHCTTALHRAAIGNSSGKLPNLTKDADRDGQTALHVAAKLGHQEVIKLLLSADKSMAHIRSYKANSKTSEAALHVAVKYGHLNVNIKYFKNSGLTETATDMPRSMWNVAKKQKQLLDFILNNVWGSELINERDLDGNTPLHLYAATKTLDGCNLISHIHADKNAFNFANFTPLDVVVQAPDQTERLNVIKDELARNGATRGFRFTFAAGFTVPVGYESSDGPNKGMAVLRHKPSFIVFVIADMIALGYSSAAVFTQFMFSPSEGEYFLWHSFPTTHGNIRIALIAMVTAFISGLFAVLSSPLNNAGNRCKIILSVWPVWGGGLGFAIGRILY